MGVKLIVTDLDQTLLRSDKTISAYTEFVLQNCKENGILLAFATARPEMAAKKYITQLDPDFVILNGGSLVKYHQQEIYKCMLPKIVTNSLISELLTNPDVGEITVTTDDGYFTNSKDYMQWTDYEDAIYNNFSTPLDLDSHKIVVEIFSDRALTEIHRNNSLCNMIRFTGEQWCSFSHKDVSKMNAIRKVINFLNISLENVAAFGDDSNDLEMVRSCGYGVAVSNAIDEVKNSAAYQTKSNDEDGVASFIETFILP